MSSPWYGRREASGPESVTANRSWWDAEAAGYLAEHGGFLGHDDFVWGPEGLRESEAHLLGEVAGLDVLEVGAGGAQCGRWLTGQGARAVSTDLSMGMLRSAVGMNAVSPSPVPLAQCDAGVLPFADGAFDLVVTAYGAVPFVADSAGLVREVARVLRPGGRYAFSTTHPIRWCFPDVPGEAGLTAVMSYWDRTPYVEVDSDGETSYVEHHRTLGDRVRDIAAAGLVLVDLVEPEWPVTNEQEWGGWSPTRGRVIPGTAIFVCLRPS